MLRVRAGELAKAASLLPNMRRQPNGVKGSLPKDTILSAAVEGVLVETPVVATLVRGEGRLSGRVSVDARRLNAALAAIVSKAGDEEGFLTVAIFGSALFIEGKMSVTIEGKSV